MSFDLRVTRVDVVMRPRHTGTHGSVVVRWTYKRVSIYIILLYRYGARQQVRGAIKCDFSRRNFYFFYFIIFFSLFSRFIVELLTPSSHTHTLPPYPPRYRSIIVIVFRRVAVVAELQIKAKLISKTNCNAII